MNTNNLCTLILQRPCPYKVPPFKFLNGHEFCPCFNEALRQSYIGGYKAGKAGEEPEVGRIEDSSAT